MSLLQTFEQKAGFTRKEAIALLTLSATFLAGMGVRWFRSTLNERSPVQRQFDYSKSDSAYAAGQNRGITAKQGPSTSPTRRTGGTSHKTTLAEKSINLNTATKSQLMNLPGVGPTFAERIIQHRQTHGNFNSVEDLSNVKGIGEKKLEKLRPFVRVK